LDLLPRGGNICYADTPTAINRSMRSSMRIAALRSARSDTAPALIALDAKMVIRNQEGERVVDAENYFIGPGIDITRMTALQPGDLLTPSASRTPGRGAVLLREGCRSEGLDFPAGETSPRRW